jgi:hypothetical protein
MKFSTAVLFLSSLCIASTIKGVNAEEDNGPIFSETPAAFGGKLTLNAKAIFQPRFLTPFLCLSTCVKILQTHISALMTVLSIVSMDNVT